MSNTFFLLPFPEGDEARRALDEAIAGLKWERVDIPSAVLRPTPATPAYIKGFDTPAEALADLTTLSDHSDHFRINTTESQLSDIMSDHLYARITSTGSAADSVIQLTPIGSNTMALPVPSWQGTHTPGPADASATGQPSDTKPVDETPASPATASTPGAPPRQSAHLQPPSAMTELATLIHGELWKHLPATTKQKVAEGAFDLALRTQENEARRGSSPLPMLSLIGDLADHAQRQDLLTRTVTAHVKIEEERYEAIKAGRIHDAEAHAERLVTAKNLNAQIARWTELSKKVPGFLLGTCIASTILALAVFALVAADKTLIGRPSIALLLFTLAIFAVSPAVLLLLERPLKGIDEWKPGAEVKDPETKTAGPTAGDIKNAAPQKGAEPAEKQGGSAA